MRFKVALVYLIAFLAVAFAPNGHADEPRWIKSAANERVNAYFDASRLRKNGDTLNVWVLINQREPSTVAGLAYTSSIANTDADCGIKTYRNRGTFFYANAMGNGTLVKSFPAEEQEKVAPPNSVIEGVIDDACLWFKVANRPKPPPPKPKPPAPLPPANPF